MANIQGSPGHIGTKAVNVREYQSQLAYISEHPEEVQAVVIDEAGRVMFHMEGREEPLQVGLLRDKYFKHYGKVSVKSWQSTGGQPIEGTERRNVKGEVMTRLKYFGLNLHLVPETQDL